jgi:hypothetical protein
MKKLKSPRIQSTSSQVKLDLDRIITNPKEEANAQELTIWQIYAYCDPEKQADYPFFRILLSPYGDALLEYAHQVRQKLFPPELDGQMDDQWANMSQAFGRAREKFLKGYRYDESLAVRLRDELETLLQEWKVKNG